MLYTSNWSGSRSHCAVSYRVPWYTCNAKEHWPNRLYKDRGVNVTCTMSSDVSPFACSLEVDLERSVTGHGQRIEHLVAPARLSLTFRFVAQYL